MNTRATILAALTFFVSVRCGAQENAGGKELRFNDSHFHLTNYIQEGITPADYLKIMGDRVPRSTLFGIPLQQEWSFRVSGDKAPTYYLDTDSDLYYYSFTDAQIAMAYRALTPAEQARFDPMITGFNPSDMYGVDHIRRVLRTFPGVFVGIGEFSVHKEFVTSKIAGEVPSLRDPALDRILDFAGEAGLVVLVHNDIALPFTKPEESRNYLEQMKELLKRHRSTTVIWAHLGLGRVVQPLPGHAKLLEEILKDPALSHVYFDISWDEAGKYLVSTPAAIEVAADLFDRYPDRFLFGTDTVAPKSAGKYFAVYDLYQPIFDLVKPETSEKMRIKNYARLFDAARQRVRAWEAKDLGDRTK